MADYTIKAYSTWPPLSAVLSDANGPIDLSTATSVTLFLEGTLGGLITGPCTITDATAGTVQFPWAAGDTDVADTYELEFKIIWSAGGDQRVPNAAANNPTVEIDASLDGSTG